MFGQERHGGQVGERHPEHVVVGLEAEGECGLGVVEGEEVGGVGFYIPIDFCRGGDFFFKVGGGKKVVERWRVGNVISG